MINETGQSSGLPWWWHPQAPVHAARGPVALGSEAGRGVTAQGVSGNTGRDARMPPGPRGWVPGWPDVGRMHGDAGRSGAGGRTPARDHLAGTVPRNVAVEQSSAVSVAGAQEGAAARRVRIPVPAVTLSDMRGQGERSPSRRSGRLPRLENCVIGCA